MTRNADIPAALGGSILVHLSVIAAIIIYFMVFILGAMPQPRLEVSSPEPQELDLVLPDMILVEEKVDPIVEKRMVIDVTSNEAIAEAPEDARFEADRNTQAASELPAVEDGKDGMPTVDGERLNALAFQQRDFSDGQTATGAVIPVIFEKTSPPSSASPLAPETPAESAEESAEAPPEMVEITEPAPEGSVLANVESFLAELETDKSSDFAADLPGEMREAEDEGFQKITELMPDEKLEEFEKEREEMEEQAKEKAQEKQSAEEKAMLAEAALQTSNIGVEIDGSVTRNGEAAVDAAETVRGKYEATIKRHINRSWQIAIDRNRDFSTVGFMRAEFFILPDGTTEGVRTKELNNNVILESLTLDVLLKIKLPPPPEELLSLRADNRYYYDLSFRVR
ncbi:MAG: hypothetical protein AAGA58_01875 [Verrucomicrobiota bacterium]